MTYLESDITGVLFDRGCNVPGSARLWTSPVLLVLLIQHGWQGCSPGRRCPPSRVREGDVIVVRVLPETGMVRRVLLIACSEQEWEHMADVSERSLYEIE
jgi:hypothetical protein